MIKQLHILKNKLYLTIFLISSLFMLILYPVLQTLATGSIHNIDLWFKLSPKQNLLLLILFSILFGLLLTMQIYNLKDKTCSIKHKTASASTGSIGAIIAFLVPACPACLSLASLIIPAALALPFVQFVTKFNTQLLILSILLTLIGIYLLGGFKDNLKWKT